MFKDRKDAGRKLAATLKAYRDDSALVLAIPLGGVEVGYYVAEYLKGRLCILVARKLPFPDNPEAGFGAIAEDGSTFILEYAARGLSAHTVQRVIEEQKREIRRRIAVLRNGQPLPQIADKKPSYWLTMVLLWVQRCKRLFCCAGIRRREASLWPHPSRTLPLPLL